MQVIIIANIVSYLFPNDKHEFSYYHKKSYLKHSIGTALASITIAEWLGEGNKYELFAYGILHDIGVILYEVCFPETIEKIQEIIIRGSHQIVAEKIVFGGIYHTDIGAWLCKKLNFPLKISEVIAGHHRPNRTTNQSRTMDIISLGDYISHIYYRDYLIKRKVEIPVKIFMEDNSLDIPEELIGEIRYKSPNLVDETLMLFDLF